MKLIQSQIRNIKTGENCEIIEPVNLYDCTLGRNVFIGPFVEIQKGVKVGENSRISSHTFVCELVTIGKDCFVGHGVNFVNDLFKEGSRGGSIENWKETFIQDEVMIGSGSIILPVKVCGGCVIGAGSVVTKDLNEKGVYAGNPAKLIRKL